MDNEATAPKAQTVSTTESTSSSNEAAVTGDVSPIVSADTRVEQPCSQDAATNSMQSPLRSLASSSAAQLEASPQSIRSRSSSTEYESDHDRDRNWKRQRYSVSPPRAIASASTSTWMSTNPPSTDFMNTCPNGLLLLGRYAKDVNLNVVTVAKLAGSDGWKTLAYSTPKSRFTVIYVEDDQFDNGQYIGKNRTPFSNSKLAGKFGMVMEIMTRIPTTSVIDHTLLMLCHITFDADRIFNAANTTSRRNVEVHNVVSLEWNTLHPFQYEYDVHPEEESDYDSDSVRMVGQPVTYRHRSISRDAQAAIDASSTIDEQRLRCTVNKCYASMYVIRCRDLARFTAACEEFKPPSGLFLVGMASNDADFTTHEWWSRITCASAINKRTSRRYIRNSNSS